MAINGAEELEAGKWVKHQVEAELGDSISGAWLDVIPEGARFPAVKFLVQNRNDVHTVAGHIVMTKLWFQVVGCVDNDKVLPLVDMANRINIGLHRRSGVTKTCRILSCIRMQPFSTMDSEQGHVFRSSGGIYELLIQSL